MCRCGTFGVDSDGATQGRLHPMPSRRRPKSPTNSASSVRPSATTAAPAVPTTGASTDIERFAAALKDSERADRAAKARQQQERMDAGLRAEHAAAKVTALATAHRELERAVQSVRAANQVGRGRAEADQAWKVAKALVIELETGTPPAWAPKPADPPELCESGEQTEPLETAEESDQSSLRANPLAIDTP